MKWALGNSNKNETHIKWIELCLTLISCFFSLWFLLLFIYHLWAFAVWVYHATKPFFLLIAEPIFIRTHNPQCVTPIQGHWILSPCTYKLHLGEFLSCFQSRARSTSQSPSYSHQLLTCNLVNVGKILASLLSLNNMSPSLHSFEGSICRKESV